MCGICGYIDFADVVYTDNVINMMIETLYHRGPNDRGCFEDKCMEASIHLGQTRLSILDLSSLGHQPMIYDSLVVVYNGEIYNYKEIRSELITLGHHFVSNTDTEVILHSFKEWGTKCVEKFIGMFAFVIYDKGNKKIYLFRDRAGVKPLYYYSSGNVLIFGSELKAINSHPAFKKEIDKSSVDLYMKYGYIPAPYCIYKNTYKIMPGTYLVMDIKAKTIQKTRYWNLMDFYKLKKQDIPYDEAKNELEKILSSSFKYRLVSDVPVGVFLSAGFDSTCVASLLQKDMTDKLKTFTIGFEDGNNEAPVAKKIAHILGTDHSEYYCTTKEAMDLVDKLPYYYDEPFADASAIPTILVSKIAKQSVSVALSADGGDETFGGYNFFDNYLKMHNHLRKIPDIYKPYFSALFGMSSYLFQKSKTKWSLDFLSEVLKDKDGTELALLRKHYDVDHLFYHHHKINSETERYDTVYNEILDEIPSTLSKALYTHYLQYMIDDVNVKVDRASMSVSLESREPFLDQRIIEYAAQLPDDYKIKDGCKKRILKDIVYQYLPKELMDTPKKGFSVPVSVWLKRDLKYLLDKYLNDDLVTEVGIFNIDYVHYVRKAFVNNQYFSDNEIWKLLMFHQWYVKWMK